MCVGQGNPCSLLMGTNYSITANFTRLVTLTVSRSGAGSGSVSSSPAGIACGADCSEIYTSGTGVTLTATASPGSVFIGWTGPCAGQANPCTLTLTDDQAVTANFAIAVTLTVTLGGVGTGAVTSSPAGINCGADCTEVYAQGTVVTLTATAAGVDRFRDWLGACTGTVPTCTVTMTTNKSVTARFRH